jgi:DNA polymerase III subunit epsilon
MKLVAIDFETADYQPDSACALGVVLIENGKITKTGYRLIRPPRNHFVFSYMHGIAWTNVRREPTFGEVWDSFKGLFRNADYLVAHYASFDRRVLAACCVQSGRKIPAHPFICTVKVAKSHWKFKPANLTSVCANLKISLRHHDAASDAMACASIAVRAMKEGFKIQSAIVGSSAPAGRPRTSKG